MIAIIFVKDLNWNEYDTRNAVNIDVWNKGVNNKPHEIIWTLYFASVVLHLLQQDKSHFVSLL
jgi:hypothetical protein